MKKPATIQKHKWKADFAWAYALIAPTVIGLFILNIYPFFQTIYLSFFKKKGIKGMQFVGLGNYEKFFNSDIVWQSTANTLLYMLYTVPIGILLAIILASLLNKKIRGKNLFRGIYFLPIVVAPSAVALVWKWIYNSDYGILNQFLSIFGIQKIIWIATPGITMVAVAIVGVWTTVGYDLILMLAGLQSIPKNLYEAADIDGVTPWQRFRYITIPMLSPVIFFTTVLRVMNALKHFDTIYLFVDNRNPAYLSTQTLMLQFFSEAFQKHNQGYASAIMIWTFFIIMLFTILQFVGERHFVHYD